MNFENQENERRTPQITGLPDERFIVPPSGGFVPEVQNEEENSQYEEYPEMVKPFSPPEYKHIETYSDNYEKNTRNSVDFEEQLEEQEIANWQAQDMIIGEKNSLWFALFGVVILVMILIAWFLMDKNWTFIGLIIVSAVAILTMRISSKHSNVVSYSLSTRGFYIGNNFYPYTDFKSFGVLKDYGTYSIVFTPKKRFSPLVSIYFPENEGEKITDIIGVRLPMEKVEQDIIDRLIRKIKL